MFILQIKFGEPVQRQTIYPNTHFTYIKFLIANTNFISANAPANAKFGIDWTAASHWKPYYSNLIAVTGKLL